MVTCRPREAHSLPLAGFARRRKRVGYFRLGADDRPLAPSQSPLGPERPVLLVLERCAAFCFG